MEKYRYSEGPDSFAHIDVSAGLRESVGNAANYKKALFVALKSIRGKLPIIFSMIDEAEFGGFALIAGTLSRICKSVGAESIAKEVGYLQSASLNGNVAVLEERLPRLGRDLEGLLTELEELLRLMDRPESVSEMITRKNSPLNEFLKTNYKAI